MCRLAWGKQGDEENGPDQSQPIDLELSLCGWRIALVSQPVGRSIEVGSG